MDVAPNRLTLCMITRNEEDFLEKCLASVNGVADEIIVVDTGSSDRTVEIAERHGAFVSFFPWNGDFSAARNASLERATSDWILVLDADEELVAEDRPKIKAFLANSAAEGHLIQIRNFTGMSSQPEVELSAAVRLFRNRWEYRFSGALHEQVGENILKARSGSASGAALAPAPLRINHYGYLSDLPKARSKSQRNLDLARLQVEANPENGFMLFNLGVEYHRLSRHEEALECFQKAAKHMAAGAMWGSKLVKTTVISLMKLGRWDEALVGIGEGLAAYPEYTDLVYLEGVALHSMRRYRRALGSFYQCLAMGPPPVPPYAAVEEGLAGHRAHYALGQCYEDMGRVAQAVRAYQAAFESSAGWLQPLYRLAALVLPREGPATIRAYLERYFDLDHQGPLVTLADIFCVAAGHAVALDYLDRAVQIAPPTAQIRYLRGICLLRTGRYNLAAEEFLQVPEDSPYYRQSALGLCFSLWSEDRVPEARAVLDRIGADQATFLSLAAMFFEEAATVLREGLKRFPESELLRQALVDIGADQAGRLEAGPPP